MDVQLEAYLKELKTLRTAVKKLTTATVNKAAIRSEAERLGQVWLRELVGPLRARGAISEDLLEPYSEAAQRLIRLSAPSNTVASYSATLDKFTKKFRENLILPLKSTPTASAPSTFDAFVSTVSDPEASEYFQEAIDCAKAGFLRASTVLVWCAAIDRIHRKIEEIGFTKYNVTSASMASEQTGRFKRFNQTQNVNSISELRQVFDTTVLWIIEGMELIDLNQHTRLRSCFDMRNHAAHPGDAPITPYNLMSVFSDIQEIVLGNPNFQLSAVSAD